MSNWRRTVMTRFLLAVWGLVTAILLFTVALLAYQMAQQNTEPAKTSSKDSLPPLRPVDVGGPSATREVTLFFANQEGRQLAPELERIDCGDSTEANCRKALEALIRGPRDILTPILPSATKVRGTYLLEEGVLVVDFSIDLQLELKKIKSASLESLMVYGIVNTLTQSALQGDKERPVTKVRFLVEGSAPRESFPAHIDVSMPIGPDTRWIANAGA
jgi:spore germination protein GerM